MPMIEADRDSRPETGDPELDAALAAARAHPVQLSSARMACLLAEAEAQADRAAAMASRQAQPRRRGSEGRRIGWRRAWHRGRHGLGGWPALAGLAGAAAAGLWLGAHPPAPLDALAATWLDAGATPQAAGYVVDLAPVTGSDLALDIGGGF